MPVSYRELKSGISNEKDNYLVFTNSDKLAMLCPNDAQQSKTTQQKLKIMATADFTTTILVDQTPEEAFNAINNVRGWWSEEIEGSTTNSMMSLPIITKTSIVAKMKLIEVVPDKKVVWLVMDNYFNFTKDKSEWTGTKIIFEISKKDSKTQIHFTHLGLVPEYECYDICKMHGHNYIQESLMNLITTGKGQPNATGKTKN